MDGNEDDEERYSADFKAKVALEAIRGDLTLAELTAKHGVHHTMIAAWKRQAIDGMAGTFSGAGDAARAVSDNEVEKLHAKIWQLVVERDFFRKASVDERGPEADDGRSSSPPSVDLGAMPSALDQPLIALLCA